MSPDEVSTLAEWREAESFPYQLLSDPEATVIKQWGLWGERKWGDQIFISVIRSHFVIGADGRFADVQIDISPRESIDRATAYFS